ncbi:MAG: hypothetical protein US50_C0006G0007 [Candidatus Nomurabacteria bacterium GW2011_GWB1_37_5]|uniref:SIMPL domain-containing protein n=1 Tax=Candidatus Nomurabacteria bacterium GW2011_GWB1_37_5 TaxID=1618742 RepID=A0A0G0JG28_9BACT|nr:MAG: hypothetical protein US50_C0006G0007 [Candidatus Nomurabacteria bacterium GW2011_GWB1_37_5]
MQQKQNYIYLGTILGISLIITGSIFGYALYKSRVSDTLSVTGSAKQKITSDTAKWTATFNRTVPQDSLKSGYSMMKADELVIMDFFKTNGVLEENINFLPIYLEDQSRYNPQAPKEYYLSRTVQVNLNDVKKITDLANNFQPIVDKGVTFSTQSLEYFYSKLPELRVALLSDAVKDAKTRASKIAEGTGKSLGVIKSASVGVVQVMPLNSVDVSDYGAYDTSSIEKEVMVTVKTAFRLR